MRVEILVSELTMFHLPELRADLLLLVQENPAHLIFDFTRTNYIDSSAIALLFKIQSEMMARKGRMSACGLKPGVRKPLETVVRSGILRFYDSLDEAMNAGE